MHIPRWKKWLSYLTPVTLEETGSDLNPELTVLLSRGRVQLLSGAAIYSWDDLYRNFGEAFKQLDLDKRPIEDVLVLGMGLGSIPFLLEKKFNRQYAYTLIEWDETVSELASRYTLSRLHSPMDIVVANAEVFVAYCEEQFDLIAVDIFEDDLTPPAFETPVFLESCAALLRPGGLLLFNRLHGESRDQKFTQRFYERTFKTVFPDAWHIDTDGNWILCYEKKGRPDK